MGLANAYSYEPLWQAHLADLRRQRRQREIYEEGAFSGLGDVSVTDVIATAASVIEGSVQYLPVINNVLQDPDLPGLIARIDKLRSFEPPSPDTGQPVGIGLHQFLAPFDVYLYIKQYPILPWLAGGALLLLIGGIGYSLGRR